MGRLLSGRRLGFVPRMITAIIWLLLFLLGLEIGSNPDVVGGMATLGVSALWVFAFSITGSIGVSWLLWRWARRRGGALTGTDHAVAVDTPDSSATPDTAKSATPQGAEGQPCYHRFLRGGMCCGGGRAWKF